MTSSGRAKATAAPRAAAASARLRLRSPAGVLFALHLLLIVASVAAFWWILDRPAPGFVDPGLWKRAYELGLRWTGFTYILLGFGAAVLAWGRAAPGPRGIAAVAAVLLVAAAAELLGTTTGLPFGPYRYGPWLGPKLAGHVPLAIPPSWFVMLYASLGIAARVAVRPAARVGLAAAGLVAWDVLMDPAMSVAFPFWSWEVEGIFYGMPLVNWAGWAVTGVVIAGAALAIGRPTRRTLARDPMAPALYAANGVLPLALAARAELWGAVVLGGGAMALFLALPRIRRHPALHRAAEALRGRLVALRLRPGFRRAALAFPPVRRLARRRARRLFDLSCGFVYSQTVDALLEGELLETLGTRSASPGELARATGLGREALEPLLRSASALGLLRRRHGRYRVGPLGLPLLEDPGLRAMLRHNRLLYRDLERPLETLRSGRGTAVSELWSYGESDPYTTLMTRTHGLITRDLLEAYPFGRHDRILDVGGGTGAFLAELARRNPRPELVLFELDPVARRARARLREWDLDGRVEVRAGDFRHDPLPDGFDLVTLIRVVHDHDDDTVRVLLAAVHRALRPGGRVLVAEPMADASPSGRAVEAYFSLFFAAMGQGQPRSPDRLVELLEEAGFRRARRHPTPIPLQTGLLTARR